MTALTGDRTHVDAATVQRRSLRILSAAQVAGALAVAGSIPAGSLIAASVAGSDGAAGLAQTAGVVGAALMALPLARLTLSGGRRPALALGYGVGIAGAIVVVTGAVTRSLVAIVLGCLLVGSASAAGYQARYAATDLAVPEHRARALSWVVWASTLGAILGPNLLEVSGALGLRLGVPQLAGPFVVAAAALALATAVLLIGLRPDPYLLSRARRAAVDPETAEEARHPRLRDGLAHLRGRPRAVLGLTAVAVGHVAMVMVMVMTPIHMRHVDMRLQVIGLVISVHVAGMYALSPLVGWAVDRVGRVRVILAGVVIVVAACVLAGLAAGDEVPLLGAGLFLLGLGWSCTLIAGSTLLTDEVGEGDRPAVQGLSDLVMSSAGALGGVIAGIVVAAGSYALLCAVATVPVLVLGAAALTPACRRPSNTRTA